MNLNLNTQIKLYWVLAGGGVLLLGIAFGTYLLGYNGGFNNGFQLGYLEETAAREIPPIALDSLDLAVDIERVLQGISEYQSQDPNQGPSPAFKGAVDEIHHAMISTVATAYGLADEEVQEVLDEYEAMSDSMATFYFEELQTMHQQRESYGSSSAVHLAYFDAAEDFSALFTDRICWVTGTAMTFRARCSACS